MEQQMMKNRRSHTVYAALLLAAVIVLGPHAAHAGDIIPTQVRPRVEAMFKAAGCAYPPESLTMIALKQEMTLEVWSEDFGGEPRLVATYPILAASGTAGPKLRQGDCQVPEGVYFVEYLNPYSRFHLSIKLDYPNEFDREKAESDGRVRLGDNIFIHGSDISKGCIAVGDTAIEKLFMMVYDMGDTPVKVIIAPYDFRKNKAVVRVSSTAPSWLPELYEGLTREMGRYRKSPAARHAMAR
jgi:murein L,D-transpeptidase YafK